MCKKNMILKIMLTTGLFIMSVQCFAQNKHADTKRPKHADNKKETQPDYLNSPDAPEPLNIIGKIPLDRSDPEAFIIDLSNDTTIVSFRNETTAVKTGAALEKLIVQNKGRINKTKVYLAARNETTYDVLSHAFKLMSKHQLLFKFIVE